MQKTLHKPERAFRFPAKLHEALVKETAGGERSTFIRASVAALLSGQRSKIAKLVPYLGKSSDKTVMLRIDPLSLRLWSKMAKYLPGRQSVGQLVTSALYQQLRPTPETGRGL